MKGVRGWLYFSSMRAVTVAKFIINVRITFEDDFMFSNMLIYYLLSSVPSAAKIVQISPSGAMGMAPVG